jgi:hypothetical protein
MPTLAPTKLTHLLDQGRASWKLCLSFRKRDWKLSDYPISIRTQESDPAQIGTRRYVPPYAASIVNWHLTGTGGSKPEALQSLEAAFEVVKAERRISGDPLPRPGTRVPIKFASCDRVDSHLDLKVDFVHRVLGFEWAFISDESSLWDFHDDETNDALIAKIREVYGVDVSDIESANVWEILDRIDAIREGA